MGVVALGVGEYVILMQSVGGVEGGDSPHSSICWYVNGLACLCLNGCLLLECVWIWCMWSAVPGMVCREYLLCSGIGEVLETRQHQ
jgi:hypothetical protein